MKIALLGYGRMGQIIEKLALAKGHEISYKTSAPLDITQLKTADVAIDFSITEAAFTNITTCFELGIPVVSGTTGWLAQYEEAVALCKAKKGSFCYASNFSIGVNLFFELNARLAELMNPFKDYKLVLEEIHHTKKRDKPSGTAITLAEDIIAHSDKTKWKLVDQPEISLGNPTQIPVEAKRFEDVKGTHIVRYASPIDSIEIKHEANTREGFAQGAILAAEFVADKTGVFSMKDVLKNII